MKDTVPSKGGDAPSPLDDFLCFSVYSVGLAFNRVYKPLLDPFGITYPQYLVLVALSRSDRQTVSELGAQVHLESNTLTPLIKRLEAAGLLTRVRDTEDERVVRVSLTKKGRGLVGEALGCVPSAVVEATGLEPKELEQLNRLLAALGRSLRNHG